jgi:hypothetical protein
MGPRVPDLTFQVQRAEAVPFAAVPTIAFSLEVVNAQPSEPVHSALVRAQIQIEAARRRYDAEEQAGLLDLFGEPDRWSTTVRSMLWTHVAIALPQFVERTTVEVPVPCTFDFNVAATKYFHGLKNGDVPLTFLFSGTVFYESGHERTLLVGPVPWDKEARFRLPVGTWQALMQHYYPNSAWLRLRLDSFDRLAAFKRRHGIPTWEEALERLLPVDQPVPAP